MPPKTLARQTSDVCYTNATVRQKEVSQFLKRKRTKTKKNTTNTTNTTTIKSGTLNKKGKKGRKNLKKLKKNNLPKEKKENQEAPVSLSAECHNVLRVLWSGKWAVATPYSLVFSIWHFVPQFRSYLQQDAQEFYNYFIDAVHMELLQIANHADEERKKQNQASITASSSSSSSSESESSVTSVSSEALEKISRDARSFVSTCFQGCAGDEIECLSCGHISKNQQIFLSLSIPIPFEHQGKSKVVSSLKRARTSIQKNKRELKKQEKLKKEKLKKKNTSTRKSISSYGSASVRAARPRVVSSIGVGDDVDIETTSTTSTTTSTNASTTASTSSSSSSSSTRSTRNTKTKNSDNNSTTKDSTSSNPSNSSIAARPTRRRRLCSSSCTIQDCLASAHSSENLMGDSQYNCEHCDCKRDATKRCVQKLKN